MTNSVLQAVILGTICLIYAIKGAIPIVGWVLAKVL